jgi:hypothetical protein
MKNALMADGKERMLANDAVQYRLRDLHAAIRAKHAEDLEQAGFFRSILIRRRIAAEFRKERRKIEPSKYSLFGNAVNTKQ